MGNTYDRMSKTERFQHMVAEDVALSAKLSEAIEEHADDSLDDRELFDVVVAPLAKSVGLTLTYEDVREDVLDMRELDDSELEEIAGGTGRVYRAIVGGFLATTIAFSTVPTAAFAEGASGGGGGGVGTSVTSALLVDRTEAEAAINSYAPDFGMQDIALPEGAVATTNGIELRNVSPVVSAAAKGEGFGGWRNAGFAVDYTVDMLGYVDKDAQKVGEFGKSLFNMIRGGSTYDLKTLLGGAKGLLAVAGVLPAEDNGPTNAELLAEIQNLNALVQAMTMQLDANTKQTYQNRLTIFDNALGALAIECSAVETMYAKGYALAEERGLINQPEPVAPAEPARAEYEQSYAELKQQVEGFERQRAEFERERESFEAEYPELENQRAGLEQEMAEWAQKRDEIDQQTQEQGGYQGKDDPLFYDYRYANAKYWGAHERLDDLQYKLSQCEAKHEEYEQKHAEYEATHAEYERQLNEAIEAANAAYEAARVEYDVARADYETAYASWQESQDVCSTLVKLMREEDERGNRDFRDFSDLVSSIRQNYEIVTVECAKQGGASPFYAFDSYWALHFNFDTQGYYLRQAYRTNAEYQLKRAYALLGLYYDIPQAIQEDENEPYTLALKDALNGIDALPAGLSPEDVRGAASGMAGFFYTAPVHSYTLNRDFRRSLFRNTLASIGVGDHYSEGEIKAYCARLHGRTVAEDLRLAGLMIDYDPSWNTWYANRGSSTRVSPQSYVGLGVEHHITGDKWITSYVPFDATSYQLREYNEDDNAHQVIFLIND